MFNKSFRKDRHELKSCFLGMPKTSVLQTKSKKKNVNQFLGMKYSTLHARYNEVRFFSLRLIDLTPGLSSFEMIDYQLYRITNKSLIRAAPYVQL